MKIKILGTRGEIKPSAPGHTNKSGVLIDNKILLDIGEPEYLKYQPDAILITHLHPDHAYFVRHKDPAPNWTIFAPEGYDNAKIFITYKPFKINGYNITPIPTVHSIKVKSNAYLIEHAGKKILYTGDMISIDKKYWNLLGNLDLVITEGSSIREPGIIRKHKETGAIFGHAGIPRLIKFFKQFTNTIVLVHFGSWFFKDIEKSKIEIEQLAQQKEIKIIVGFDGLEVNI